MTLRRFLIVILAFGGLAACDIDEQGQFTTISEKPETTERAAVAPAQVALLSERPDAAFTELGPIKVTVNKLTAFHPNPTEEAVQQALREKAAALGADAIIDVTITGIHIAPLSWGARSGEGIAIAY